MYTCKPQGSNWTSFSGSQGVAGSHGPERSAPDTDLGKRPRTKEACAESSSHTGHQVVVISSDFSPTLLIYLQRVRYPQGKGGNIGLNHCQTRRLKHVWGRFCFLRSGVPTSTSENRRVPLWHNVYRKGWGHIQGSQGVWSSMFPWIR